MGKVILIIWLIHPANAPGVAIDHIEYNSFFACKQAQTILNDLTEFRSVCTNKGSNMDDIGG